MNCKWCGAECTEDYFVLDIKRIKDAELFIPSLLPSIVLCFDCYEKLRKTASGLYL